MSLVTYLGKWWQCALPRHSCSHLQSYFLRVCPWESGREEGYDGTLFITVIELETSFEGIDVFHRRILIWHLFLKMKHSKATLYWFLIILIWIVYPERNYNRNSSFCNTCLLYYCEVVDQWGWCSSFGLLFEFREFQYIN